MSRLGSLQLEAAACAECQMVSGVKCPAERWLPCRRISVRQAWQGSRRASSLCWWPQTWQGAVLMSRPWPASSTTTCPTASRTTPIALGAQGAPAKRAMQSHFSPCRQGSPVLKARTLSLPASAQPARNLPAVYKNLGCAVVLHIIQP